MCQNRNYTKNQVLMPDKKFPMKKTILIYAFTFIQGIVLAQNPIIPNKGATIEIRKNSPSGELLASCKIDTAKSATGFESIRCNLPKLEDKLNLCFYCERIPGFEIGTKY
jgi:hypothetical protein